MADLIDRQAAIDVLNKLARDNFTLKEAFSFYLGALHDASDGIKELPPAQPEPRWIPMAVRYPSDGQLILVQFFNGCHEVIHFSAVGLKDHIEAWMPLPKPYKEDSDG